MFFAYRNLIFMKMFFDFLVAKKVAKKLSYTDNLSDKIKASLLKILYSALLHLTKIF